MLGMEGLSGDSQSSCDHGSGPVGKLDLPLAHREFLRGSGILMGSLAGSSLLALAPSGVWALELQHLRTDEGKVLMAMGRTLYPHSRLPDAVYALLVKDLDADKGHLRLLRGGIEQLNKAAGGAFANASHATRLEAVTALDKTPFYAKVRGQCISSLYDNDMAYAAFGYPRTPRYPGSCLRRGFQALKWLPDPHTAASPQAFSN